MKQNSCTLSYPNKYSSAGLKKNHTVNPLNASCGLSLLLVLSFCSERFFSGYSGFPLSSKTDISKLQFDRESGRRRTTLWMCFLQIIIVIIIIIIINPPPPYGKLISNTFWGGGA